MGEEYSQERIWKSTKIAFLKHLAAINKKRPVNDPMSFIEFMDEVAHGRIKLAAKVPVRTLRGI